MKSILYTIIICWTLIGFGQNKHEFYFNIDLDNHINEQLFHVDANSNNFQFALVGVIKEGNKQLLANRYTLKKINFLIRNFIRTPQRIKLDKVIFNEMTNDTTHLFVYASKENTFQEEEEEDWFELDLGKIGLRKTIIDITMWYDENGDGNYREMKDMNKGFGDHICKSRITF